MWDTWDPRFPRGKSRVPSLKVFNWQETSKHNWNSVRSCHRDHRKHR